MSCEVFEQGAREQFVPLVVGVNLLALKKFERRGVVRLGQLRHVEEGDARGGGGGAQRVPVPTDARGFGGRGE